MGSQDRDWHREWWAKKQGYIEKARFRLPDPKPHQTLHPVLIAMVWAVVFLVLFIFFKRFR